MSNLSENRIDLVLDAATIQTMTDSIRTFISLIPDGTTLTDEQRLRYTSINVANKVFAEDVLSETATLGTEVLSPYLKPIILENDLIFFKQLDDITNLLLNAIQRTQDAQRIAGHEAYSLATAMYNAIKMASDAGIPNAKAAYTKLKVRFDAQGSTGRTPAVVPEEE